MKGRIHIACEQGKCIMQVIFCHGDFREMGLLVAYNEVDSHQHTRKVCSWMGAFPKALASCTRVREIFDIFGRLSGGWSDDIYSLGAKIASQGVTWEFRARNQLLASWIDLQQYNSCDWYASQSRFWRASVLGMKYSLASGKYEASAMRTLHGLMSSWYHVKETESREYLETQ